MINALNVTESSSRGICIHVQLQHMPPVTLWRGRRDLAHAGPGSDGVVFAPPQDLGMVKQAQRQVSATGRHGDPFLAGYKLLGPCLGMGAFGVVRLGFRKDSGASCAINIVNIDAQDATCRFRREAHLLSKLHHESIVPLLEYFPPSPAFQREEAVLVFPERERGFAAVHRAEKGRFFCRTSRGPRWHISASSPGRASWPAGWHIFIRKA